MQSMTVWAMNHEGLIRKVFPGRTAGPRRFEPRKENLQMGPNGSRTPAAITATIIVVVG